MKIELFSIPDLHDFNLHVINLIHRREWHEDEINKTHFIKHANHLFLSELFRLIEKAMAVFAGQFENVYLFKTNPYPLQILILKKGNKCVLQIDENHLLKMKIIKVHLRDEKSKDVFTAKITLSSFGSLQWVVDGKNVILTPEIVLNHFVIPFFFTGCDEFISKSYDINSHVFENNHHFPRIPNNNEAV